MFKIVRAVRFLFIAPVLLLFLFVVNLLTTPHQLWVKWAVLGIGFAWVLSLMRVVRAAILAGGLAALITYLRRK
jgi:ABC-type dipeptide/oligopeptide/nickel transport system permease subunit